MLRPAAAGGGPLGRLEAVGRRRPLAANIGGIAAHCAGIFGCTQRPVWPVGGVVVAGTAFLVSIHHIIVIHRYALYFSDFDRFRWFAMVLGGFERIWEGFGRFGREWHMCGLAYVRTRTCADWHMCGPAHVRTGTCTDQHMCGLAHVRTGTYLDWHMCGPVHLRTSTCVG